MAILTKADCDRRPVADSGKFLPAPFVFDHLSEWSLNKPFAPATDRNKGPILAQLRHLLTEPATVLEIGSGTGQHAVHFSAALPHLIWQCTDLPHALEGMRQWLDEAGTENLYPPIVLDVRVRPWPFRAVEVVYTANTLHIMDWDAVRDTFAGAAQVLKLDGRFMSYGPFCYHGVHTSEGNAGFDRQLRFQGAGSGIRDIDDLEMLATDSGLKLCRDIEMPANNRLLIWSRRS